MSATIQLFLEDHSHALEMLRRLHDDLLALKLSQDLPAVKKGLEEFVSFLDNALKIHFRQEETALFPVMIKANENAQKPIEAMLEEHRLIEAAHRSLQEELRGDKPSPEVISHTGEQIIELLTNHIHREDQALFPFALRVMNQEHLEEVESLRVSNSHLPAKGV